MDERRVHGSLILVGGAVSWTYGGVMPRVPLEGGRRRRCRVVPPEEAVVVLRTTELFLYVGLPILRQNTLDWPSSSLGYGCMLSSTCTCTSLGLLLWATPSWTCMTGAELCRHTGLAAPVHRGPVRQTALVHQHRGYLPVATTCTYACMAACM